MEHKKNITLLIFLFGLLLIVGAYFNFLFTLPSPPRVPTHPESVKISDFKKFSSAEEFLSYLRKSDGMFSSAAGFTARSVSLEGEPLAYPGGEAKGGEVAPERYSETNVQVLGVDEPDIVKTDGKNIYISSQLPYYGGVFFKETAVPFSRPFREESTKVVKAFPVSELKIESKIDKAGRLLLQGDNLIVFSSSLDKVYGFDVKDSKNPVQKWVIELKDNSQIDSARLYNNKIYLVSKTKISSFRPCPLKPLAIGGQDVQIACKEIYHPAFIVPVDTTYTVLVISPESGKLEKKLSFVGNSGTSVVYMSKGNIYVTYSSPSSITKIYYEFFKEKASDLVPAYLIKRLEKLNSYDISEAAKMTELRLILQNFYNSLDNNEKLRITNELENRSQDYFKLHKRELSKTSIAKISLDDFKISAFGVVPGKILNQFSLDEYQDYLRVAVTVGGGWFGLFGGRTDSANDVYVLGKNLKIKGKVQNLAEGERIYSVRFIEDKGYVVTFKQTDPFFVLDLSDPENPSLKGELKIPGYSSYLHPITEDKILGVGKERQNVKISLFDVSNPASPKEISKFTLNEYWSDILNTHHAFLLDKKHQVFFLPGSKGGYVFSYQNNNLTLKRAASGISPKRAVYINDYLYIIGRDKMTVLDETNWQKIKELEI
jgi:uncharacterized secreted protein with C-terminal beta-propeller domain